MKKNLMILLIVLPVFSISFLVFKMTNFNTGLAVFENLFTQAKELLMLFPIIMLLTSLAEVWVEKDKIVRFLGKDAGFMSIILALFLGALTVGPWITALPLAASLSKKGAGNRAILIFLGSAAVCRIPMTLFELSIFGIKMPLIRFGVSIPVIVATGLIFGPYLDNRNYRISI